jgi:DNA-binding PadR family transcriptional regulator
MDSMVHNAFLGFIKIQILHDVSKEPVCGMWLIDEFKRHGYVTSPRSLYPIFHALEADNMMSSGRKAVKGKIR